MIQSSVLLSWSSHFWQSGSFFLEENSRQVAPSASPLCHLFHRLPASVGAEKTTLWTWFLWGWFVSGKVHLLLLWGQSHFSLWLHLGVYFDFAFCIFTVDRYQLWISFHVFSLDFAGLLQTMDCISQSLHPHLLPVLHFLSSFLLELWN